MLGPFPPLRSQILHVLTVQVLRKKGTEDGWAAALLSPHVCARRLTVLLCGHWGRHCYQLQLLTATPPCPPCPSNPFHVGTRKVLNFPSLCFSPESGMMSAEEMSMPLATLVAVSQLLLPSPPERTTNACHITMMGLSR